MGPRDALLALLVAAAITATSLVVVDRAQTDAEWPDHSTGSDVLEYQRMAAGGVAARPFAFRVLDPAIARALPVAPARALELVGLASAALATLGLLVFVRSRGASWGGTILACVMVACAPCFTILWFNPSLTDGLALLVLVAGFLALDRGWFAAFVALCVAGVATRETLVVMPALLLLRRDWRRAGIAAACALGTLLAVHLLVTAGPAQTPTRADLVAALVGGARGWGPLLLVAGLWVARAPVAERWELALLAALALASASLATDTERMFLVMAPLVALLAARRLDSAGWLARSVIVAIAALQVVVYTPTRLIWSGNELRWGYQLTQLLMIVMAVALAIVALHRVLVREAPKPSAKR